jgi:drug/metabolite transporter (DMT)-like permease
MYKLYGFILVFLAAAAFGASGIVIKFAYQAGISPQALLPLQNIFATVCLWGVLLSTGGLPRISALQWQNIVIQGIFANMGITVCYFLAAERIDISLLSIIMFTYPGIVFLYATLFEKRRAENRDVLALIIALGGAVLAVDPFSNTLGKVDEWGLVLAVGTAIAYAFMNIGGEKLTNQLPPLVVSTLTTTVSTLGLILMFGSALTPQTIALTAVADWVLIAVIGLLSTVLPMNLLYMGIRRIGAFYASVISISELPLVLIFSYFMLGERLSLWQTVGGTLILFSVAVLHIEKPKVPSKE